MLLVVSQPAIPWDPAVTARAAALCGLAPVDIQLRLGGPLPRVLLSDASAERVQALAAALTGIGVRCFACDPAKVPGDGQRIVVRRLEAHPSGLLAVARDGAGHLCARDGVRLIQRAVRVGSESETVKVAEKKFSLGRTALTGGLMTRKTVEREVQREAETREPCLVVHRDDGPELVLYERRLDYRFLGPEMGPASAANLLATLRWLRAAAPEALVDERVLRPGFVKAMPAVGADPVDLALHLVWIACRAGS